ncbi:hypothetical protein GCM10010267_06400 [Streptomyces griseorubens]|nr:hypothetical protein GCM10010267_06400 [Streptomyces griseorubens]
MPPPRRTALIRRLRIGRLIRHGQAARALDPEVSSDWIEQVLWAHVSSRLRGHQQGELPRHGASAWVMRTLENGTGACGI